VEREEHEALDPPGGVSVASAGVASSEPGIAAVADPVATAAGSELSATETASAEPAGTPEEVQETAEVDMQAVMDEQAASHGTARSAAEHDVLEQTPEFLRETPEHERLWFEQRPPRDFDFDD
jgi:hypothetical protein